MQLGSCRLVSGGEGIGEREMDGEVCSAVGDHVFHWDPLPSPGSGTTLRMASWV